jgi:hypothetical protein
MFIPVHIDRSCLFGISWMISYLCLLSTLLTTVSVMSEILIERLSHMAEINENLCWTFLWAIKNNITELCVKNLTNWKVLHIKVKSEVNVYFNLTIYKKKKKRTKKTYSFRLCPILTHIIVIHQYIHWASAIKEKNVSGSNMILERIRKLTKFKDLIKRINHFTFPVMLSSCCNFEFWNCCLKLSNNTGAVLIFIVSWYTCSKFHSNIVCIWNTNLYISIIKIIQKCDDFCRYIQRLRRRILEDKWVHLH